jgi:hypothetical protein
MGGKTGTAQVRRITGGQRGQSGAWKYRDHGLFVCFAPTDDPRYAAAVVIEHGMGGSRAAAPVAKDVLTYLFDKPKAMEASPALEQSWGGTLAERTERRAERWLAEQRAKAAAPIERRRQRTNGRELRPAPVASLPWRMLWVVLALGWPGCSGSIPPPEARCCHGRCPTRSASSSSWGWRSPWRASAADVPRSRLPCLCGGESSSSS